MITDQKKDATPLTMVSVAESLQQKAQHKQQEAQHCAALPLSYRKRLNLPKGSIAQ